MQRRQLLAGVVAAGIGAAGCIGQTSGETVVNERVRSSSTFNFEASPGDTIELHVDNEEGMLTYVGIEDPDDELLLEADVETEDTFTVDAEADGVHRLYVSPSGRASVELGVSS